MSKYVKNLVIGDIQRRLNGVNDALVVNVIGLDSGKTYLLRKKLREKKIQLLVVKNSLAKRATEGSSLSTAFDSMEGSSAICWGSEDFVSLTKEIAAINKSPEFEKFETRGGVLDGSKLTAEKVKEISKWPNRLEQLGILLGQILSPGATLLGQLSSPGGALMSQLKQKSEGAEAEAAAPEGAAPAPEGAPGAAPASAAPEGAA